MNRTWRDEIRRRWLTIWALAAFGFMAWLALRAASSFPLTDTHRVFFSSVIWLAIAIASPLIGFFIGWCIFAYRSIWGDPFGHLRASDASQIVVKSSWLGAILFCVAIAGVLSAFDKLDLSNIWSVGPTLAGGGASVFAFIRAILKK